MALGEKLIKFRFDHEVGPCMEAGDALTRRYGLASNDREGVRNQILEELTRFVGKKIKT